MEGANWMDIRSDRQKGMSYAEIARKYHIDPRTAKRYAESDTRPVYSLSDSKPSKLDPHKEQITIWLEEAPYSALRRDSIRWKNVLKNPMRTKTPE
jgi:transposase